MMRETEIWKFVTIAPFTERYQASNLGRIKSLAIGRHKGRVLKLHKHKRRGYLECGLSVRGFRKTSFVHRLVGTSFLTNPENKPEINHKDGNRQNNAAENLEWATSSENNLHSYRVLHRKNHQSGKFGIASAVAKGAAMLAPDDSVLKFYGSLAEAGRVFGAGHENVMAACKGRTKTAYGYSWRYATQEEIESLSKSEP